MGTESGNRLDYQALRKGEYVKVGKIDVNDTYDLETIEKEIEKAKDDLTKLCDKRRELVHQKEKDDEKSADFKQFLELSEYYKLMYAACKQVGFSEEQAFDLTLATIPTGN